VCEAERKRKDYKDNREVRKACSNRYRKKYPDRVKKRKARRYSKYSDQVLLTARLRRHGVTKEWWEERLEIQNHKCDSCDRVLEPGKKTHIDHDHKTGEVRGILCSLCNTGIGALGDSLYGLLQAIRYLLGATPCNETYRRRKDAEVQKDAS